MVREVSFDMDVDVMAGLAATEEVVELIPADCGDCGQPFYSAIDGSADPHPTPLKGHLWVCESCFAARKRASKAERRARQLLDDIRMVPEPVFG